MSGISKSFFSFLFILSHLIFSGQVIVSGKVLYKGKGLKGASVSSRSASSLSQPVKTDGSGRFELEAESKEDIIQIRKKGYISQNVIPGSEVQLIINLEKASRRKKRFKSGCPPGNPLCACCFRAGTKILLEGGREKNIEQIKPGDIILNVNLRNFTIQTDTVYAIDSVIHTNLIEIELENKTTITSTTDHPYFIEGKGWCSFDAELTNRNYGIKASELKIGDSCLVYSAGNIQQIAIVKIKRLEETRMTYNISGLYHQSNYFANGVLVSNEKEVYPLCIKK